MNKNDIEDKMNLITGESSDKPYVPYIVHEQAMVRAERREKWHWMFHVLLALIVAMMMWNFFQYDTIAQDGEGVNIVGEMNEVNSGAESKSPNNDQKQGN